MLATGWEKLKEIDGRVRSWMGRYGVLLLRISLGSIFLWFGVLKFFPNLSPAEALAEETIEVLTFGLVPIPFAIKILAAWECLIGVGLISGKCLRIVLLLLAMQMIGAMAPVVLFPDKVFVHVPLVPTLEGQYIIKNLVLISAGIVLGAQLGKLPSLPVGKKQD